MNNVNLSKRLTHVASLIDSGSIVQDVGSDHALLPIFLLQNKIIEKAYATDVNQGPYLTALKNVQKYNLEKSIIVKKNDGIENLSSEVNTLCLCGMGGSLIVEILEKGKDQLLNIKNIIVTPNVGSDKTRRWFMENGYQIETELIIQEEEIIYEIIKAVKIEYLVEYTEDELIFGPKLLKEKNNIFYEKWTRELIKIRNILKMIPDNNSQSYILNTTKLKRIEKVILNNFS